MEWLQDLLIVLGVALFVSALSRRLRLPSVVGFLATGAIAGPSGLGWVKNLDLVQTVAELGVVFLLFLVGMEITRERLRELSRPLLVGGSLQVLFTTAFLLLLIPLAGMSWRLSVFLGAATALSSTAIVLDLLYAKNEMRSPHGKSTMGVLLFQDFLIVPLMVLLPMLAGKAGGDFWELLGRMGGGFLLVLGAAAAGRWFLPFILKEIVDSRIRELLVLGTLFTCLGSAFLTEHLGFSMALGSFLAGVLIAESDYRHQIFAEMLSFRDLFQSLFFVSIGMLFSFSHAFNSFVPIISLTVGIILIKVLAGALAIRVYGLPWPKAWRTGLCLAQIGEFAFVLLLEGFKLGILDHELYQTLLSSSILSMVTTPFLMWIGSLADQKERKKELLQKEFTPDNKENSQKIGKNELDIIVAGYGTTGQNIARVLKEGGLRYRLIDIDGLLLRSARKNGEPVFYGDASHPEILRHAGIEKVSTIVFTIPDPVSLRRGIRVARFLNPEVYIIVRAHEKSELEELKNLGADEVVAEVFETSIELVTRLLHRAHVPMNVIRSQARLLRGDSYQMMRSQEQGPDFAKRILDILSEGTTDTFLLASDSPVIGKNLIDLDMRRKSGVQVVAVVRGTKSYANPSVEWIFEEGDVLVMIGSHAQMEKAWKLLENRSESETAEDASVT